MTIWKYSFDVADEFTIRMPAGALVLSVQVQNGQPCMWAQVHEGMALRTYHFRAFGTGHPIPDEPLQFMGTIQTHGGMLVFHVFERLAS